MSDGHEIDKPDEATHERVAEMIRAVDVQAPPRLHQAVREMTDAHRQSARGLMRSRLKPTLAAMAVAAAAGAAIALLSGGATRSLSVSEASALTLRAPTMAAPKESGEHLDAAVEGIPFPYWGERFGWRSAGARTDKLAGREVTTVFYTGPHAVRIGYSIVGGTPAPSTSSGTVNWRDGVSYRLLKENGAQAVVWRRDGRLCILSGRNVSSATLLALASWEASARRA